MHRNAFMTRFFVARAVVIAENGLRARRYSAERHGDDKHEALHDGSTRDEHIAVCAAVLAQHDVDGDEQHVIKRDDERRRQTDLHDTAHPAEIDRLTGNADSGSAAEQKPQNVRRRARLRQHGRKSGSAHAHVQRKNEHRVKCDIYGRSEHNRPHCGTRKSPDSL